jgi:hypothetical protein
LRLHAERTKGGRLTAHPTSPSTMASRYLYSTSHLVAGQQTRRCFAATSLTFLTNAFWGENATGNWTLNVADIEAGNTGTWNAYNVTFLMGNMVMFAPGAIIQSADVNALSLTVLNNATTYTITAGRTFQVSRNVLVDGGTLIVNGQLTEKGRSYATLQSSIRGRVQGQAPSKPRRGLQNTGGTVSPGNSVGTLNLVGNYTRAGRQAPCRSRIPDEQRPSRITGSASLGGTRRRPGRAGPRRPWVPSSGTFSPRYPLRACRETSRPCSHQHHHPHWSSNPTMRPRNQCTSSSTRLT